MPGTCEPHRGATAPRGYPRVPRPIAVTLAAVVKQGSRDRPSLADRFPERVAELSRPAERGGRVGVNRYLADLWSRRADLQEAWPDLDGPGGSWLVEWAYGHAYDDVPIPEELLPARGLSDPADVGAAAGVTRYLYGVWLRRPDLQHAFPDLDGADAASLVDWAHRYGRHEDRGLAAWLDGPPTRARSRARRSCRAPDGVNVVGYLDAEMGLSEAARLVIRGLDAQRVPVLPVSQDLTEHPEPHGYTAVPAAEARFAVDLLCLNPRQLWRFLRGRGRQLPAGGHAVGYWWWEIPGVLPIEWWVGFELVDEVWAGSEVVARALEPMSPVPVVRVRLPVAVQPAPHLERAELGLPEGYVFLFAFDHDSNFERKNPLAAIEAFRVAFPERGRASLVIKCINAQRHAREHRRLLAAARTHPDVHVIDEVLSTTRHRALFAACDCYLSLHRAEGFGLTLAEAMAQGKPVIATGWSGNLDYMTDRNSYLVSHRLVKIGDANPNYYPRDAWWAEPELADAVRCMRHVVANPAEAAERGRRGAADLERAHSPAVAGETMLRRLEDLAATRARRVRRVRARLSPRRRLADKALLERAAKLAAARHGGSAEREPDMGVERVPALR
jgi:hypothetical protein